MNPKITPHICCYALLTALFFLMLLPTAFSQRGKHRFFRVVPLGITGGIDESNLSAYMIAVKGTANYICADAGTLHYGILKAIQNKVFSVPAEEVLKKYIKGYLISHAHLDHIAGLIINSPDDTAKNIYALRGCIEAIEAHYFNWKSWANFTDEGAAPLLNKYHYDVLVPDSAVNIRNTTISVRAFQLSHSGLESTAFLMSSQDAYLLYMGDTGPDEIEKSQDLHILWQAVGPLIRDRKLKGIFIETSYPDEQADKNLYGHLTPHWLMKEMEDLAVITGKSALKGFNIIITHVKPPQLSINKIKAQLRAENMLQLHLVFPEQGRAFDL